MNNPLNTKPKPISYTNQLPVILHFDYPPLPLSAIKTIGIDFRISVAHDSQPRWIIRKTRFSSHSIIRRFKNWRGSASAPPASPVPTVWLETHAEWHDLARRVNHSIYRACLYKHRWDKKQLRYRSISSRSGEIDIEFQISLRRRNGELKTERIFAMTSSNCVQRNLRTTYNARTSSTA